MELIKKTIKLTKDANYNFVLLLTSKVKDWGFFDSVPFVYGYGYDNFSEGIGLENLE